VMGTSVFWGMLIATGLGVFIIPGNFTFVESLGIGGFFVRTREKLPLRCLVQILLDLPVGQVRCRAIVRNIRENYGVGVQIIAMDPTDRARLFQQVNELLTATTA